MKLEDLLKQKGLENKVTNSFDKRVEKEKVLLQNSAKPPTTNSQIDSRKEIADFANTSHDTVMKVKEIKKDMPAEVKNDLENKINFGDISINQAHIRKSSSHVKGDIIIVPCAIGFVIILSKTRVGLPCCPSAEETETRVFVLFFAVSSFCRRFLLLLHLRHVFAYVRKRSIGKC